MKIKFQPGRASKVAAIVDYTIRESDQMEILVAPTDDGWTATDGTTTATGDDPTTALTNMVNDLPPEGYKAVEPFTRHITLVPVGETATPNKSTTTVRFDFGDSAFGIVLTRCGSTGGRDVVVQPAGRQWRAVNTMVGVVDTIIDTPDGVINLREDGVRADCVQATIDDALFYADAVNNTGVGSISIVPVRKRPNLIAIGKAVSEIVRGASPVKAIIGKFPPEILESAYVELDEWIDVSLDEPVDMETVDACRRIRNALREVNQ